MEQSTAAPRKDVIAFMAATVFGAAMYAVPGEWIAAFAPLRIALVSSAVAAGLLLLRKLSQRERLFIDGGRGIALGLFALLVLFSVKWSLHPEGSRENAIEVFKYVAIYLTMVNVITTQRRLAIFCGALVLASIVTSIGAIQWFNAGVDMVEGYRTRWVGVYADPNIMAMNLAIIVPLALAFFASKRYPWAMRLACLTAAILALVAITLSYSRGGFLGLATAGVVWAVLEKRPWQLAVVGIAAIGLLVFAPKTFWERNSSVTEFREDASAMARVHAWSVTAGISKDAPLLGVGAGSFRYAWPLYAPPEARRAYQAHNVFLEVIAELGFLGLGLYLVFVGGAVGGAYAAARRAAPGSLTPALAAAATGYLVSNLFAGHILSAHLFVLFGVAACADRLARAEAEEPLPAVDPDELVPQGVSLGPAV